MARVLIFIVWLAICGIAFAETKPSPKPTKSPQATATASATPSAINSPPPAQPEKNTFPYAIAGLATVVAIGAIGFQQSMVNRSNRLRATALDEKQKAESTAKDAERDRAAIVEKYASVIDLDALKQQRVTEREALDLEIKSQRERWKEEIRKSTAECSELKNQVVFFTDMVEMQSVGLYEPIYDFDSSERYKDELKACYEKQKHLIKLERAIVCTTEWRVEGSLTKGKDMTKRYTKLMLRAFNGEADVCVAKARFDNVNQLKDRIWKSFEAINTLGKSHQISITSEYREARIAELHLAYEMARKKEQEKEEQRAIRAQMKEEEDARKEIERAQKDAEVEEARYAKALEAAKKELESARDGQREALRKKIALLEQQFEEAHNRKAKAIARAQLTKSGHVYIISNLGSFGEEVFKIGMTRRLEPIDRVTELGGASVPFRFDVHAMIYAEDAPALEHSIHQKFSNRQINRVNPRREFFRVTLDEIETAVRELCDKETEFVRTAVAEEFRESESIRQKEESERLAVHQVKVKDEVAQARERLATLKESWKAEPVA